MKTFFRLLLVVSHRILYMVNVRSLPRVNGSKATICMISPSSTFCDGLECGNRIRKDDVATREPGHWTARTWGTTIVDPPSFSSYSSTVPRCGLDRRVGRTEAANLCVPYPRGAHPPPKYASTFSLTFLSTLGRRARRSFPGGLPAAKRTRRSHCESLWPLALAVLWVR